MQIIDLINDLRLVSLGEFQLALEKLQQEEPENFAIVLEFLTKIDRRRKRNL